MLVVTADSGGDFENATISKFCNGKFSLLHTINNQNLGKLYRNMTFYLGMKPYEHEYKVMGLAGYVNKDQYGPAYDIFASTMDVYDINFIYNLNFFFTLIIITFHYFHFLFF